MCVCDLLHIRECHFDLSLIKPYFFIQHPQKFTDKELPYLEHDESSPQPHHAGQFNSTGVSIKVNVIIFHHTQ